MKVNVKILRNDNNAIGRLADAELHFIGGELDGLKLIGFAVWRRRDGNGWRVTFPAGEIAVDGRLRRVPIVRSWMDGGARKRLRDLVRQAYAIQVNPAGRRFPNGRHPQAGTTSSGPADL